MHVVIAGDVGIRSWVQAEWKVGDAIVDEGTRSLTFKENAKETHFVFSFLPSGGWPVGKHEVILTANDEMVATKSFTITESEPSVARKSDSMRKKAVGKRTPNRSEEPPVPVENPTTAEQFNDRGEQRFHEEEYDDALADFSHALKLDPEFAPALVNRGWVYVEQGDLTTAELDFADAIRLAPTLPAAYEGQAVVLMDQEKLTEAIASYTNAIRHSVDNKQAALYYNERAMCFQRVGNLKSTLDDLQRAVEKDPQFARAYANRGDVLSQAGQYEDAVLAMREAIAIDRQDPEFYHLLGLLHFDHGEYEAAADSHAAAIARDDEDPRYYRGRAAAYRELDRQQSAIKDLRRAISLDPQDSLSVNDLGLLYFASGEYEAARDIFSQAIELAPDDLAIRYNRADTLLRLDDKQGAIDDLTILLKSGDDPHAYALRGRAFSLEGNTDAAGEDFAEAVRLAPDDYHLQRAKSLRVTNETKESLKVFLQYFASTDGKEPAWLPGEEEALIFNFKPGLSAPLLLESELIVGSKVRIWAVGLETGKVFEEFKVDELELVGSEGYLTTGTDLEEALYGFSVADAQDSATQPPHSLPPTAMNSNYPRRAIVNSLTYSNTPTGAAGNCTSVEITVDKNPGRSLKVGFIEEGANSLGGMWRASAWVATVLGADITGFDPLETQVLFEGQGYVDGPSAGGVLTIGILAALRGEAVRPDTAMTGTINPDGTIGPVGGIPHKLEGAAAAGKKLVLIPAGLERGMDVNKNQLVDLVEHGRKLGLEVKPVGDIYSAYALLTGHPLPRPEAAPLPELDPAMKQRLNAKVEQWLARFRASDATFRKTPAQYRTEVSAGMLEQARKSAARAAEQQRQGNVAIAFQDAVDAARLAAIASELDRTVWVDAARGRETAIKYARTVGGIDQKMKDAFAGLKSYQPTTLSAAGILLHGYSTLVEALAIRTAGEALLAKQFALPLGETAEEQEAAGLLMAGAFIQIAALHSESIIDVLEIAGEVGGAAMPQNAPLVTTAKFFRSAAEANLQQFEQTVVNERAKEENIEFNVMKHIMMQQDQTYMIVRLALDETLPALHQHLEDEHLAYAVLAGAMHTYIMSSRLTAEYYSLGIERDSSGIPGKIRYPSALDHMLDFAEDQSCRNIQLLRSHDIDPMASVFFTQAATALRQRELPDRLGALTAFWQANLQSRTLAYLGGFAGQTDAP